MSEQLSSLAYRNFTMTCRSAATRKAYVRCLDHFMKYLKIDTYDKLLDKDPKIIQMDICDFISFMRKDRSYAMVSLYVAAINKFYAINDIILNMKKIRAFMGEHEKIAEDRRFCLVHAYSID
ncbi:MAG: hypothetical protein WAL24_11260 [Nitrososphaeraceae archaeon]